MKLTAAVAFVVLAATCIARSQTAGTDQTAVSPAAPVVTTARILGDIPDGTPPAPQAPKPEYKVANSDVLQTTTQEQGGRTITIQQIKPIALPPPPAPEPAQAAAKASGEFQQRLAAFQEAHPRSEMMFIGATVYRSGDQPPRTLIHIWPQGGGEAIELWSNIDMALIAGGVGNFQDSAGNTHNLMISWSNLYIDRLADLYASQGREYTPPPMPAFVAGKATFQVVGNQPAAEDLTAIQSLHDLYNNEHDRLQTAYEGREQARQQREAELKVNPPQPKDITLRFWHSKRPAAQVKGGAQ